MAKHTTLLCYFILFILSDSYGQSEYIRTKEGRSMLNRRQLIANCLKALHKDRSDQTAVSICECQANILDGAFTDKQFRKYSEKGVVDISSLIKTDSIIENRINNCYRGSGKIALLQAESFEADFISSCMKSIEKSTQKTLDLKKVENFCDCQLELVKSKKITDVEMQTLADPNSLFFYEMIYKCGNPFEDSIRAEMNWSPNTEKDIKGPSTDTIKTLSINGMTYVKMKIGSLVQIWLFDTGASDMLINKEMEEKLKKENVIKKENFLGLVEYEMANGVIDICRTYKIDNVKMGQFSINNVVVAVTDKGKKTIVGRSLLNKFGNWIINNKNDTIILMK